MSHAHKVQPGRHRPGSPSHASSVTVAAVGGSVPPQNIKTSAFEVPPFPPAAPGTCGVCFNLFRPRRGAAAGLAPTSKGSSHVPGPRHLLAAAAGSAPGEGLPRSLTTARRGAVRQLHHLAILWRGAAQGTAGRRGRRGGDGDADNSDGDDGSDSGGDGDDGDGSAVIQVKIVTAMDTTAAVTACPDPCVF
ncbi:hypothetical protein E2C01_085431 [Portunus trituberculatus]|uniref:Uncharacterized protein n=1 Tax=Portunus trituberculatus TaxID=210409 RepID=A0A5B7J7K9_PORTR|nr:hypothetical protein [Portunus trituberculatus]